MAELDRRAFLKLAGLTGTGALAGCSSESARKLIPYVIPPEDIVPGRAAWYATTCRECPAGCGILAKNMDGRIVKVEGNPLHPVNRGRLCARGQAALQGLYNPDRIRGPAVRSPQGKLEPVAWVEAERRLIEWLREAGDGRTVFLTELVTGTLRDLIERWLERLGAGRHVMYEPFSHESLRKANEIVFGTGSIPVYRIDRADFLLCFGADFLESWLSPVEHARRFAAFRGGGKGAPGAFVFVGPRLSLTGANADHWIQVPPGTEYLVAVGMLRAIAEGEGEARIPHDLREALRGMVEGWSLEAVRSATGVDGKTIRRLARRFAAARRPLALAGGVSSEGPRATELAVAANLLCALKPGGRANLEFGSGSALERVARAEQMRELFERMRGGGVALLLLHNANPLFSFPPSFGVSDALAGVKRVVSFSSFPDETAQRADLLLPTHTFLESWGDHAPRGGVEGLMQPVMGALFDTRNLGDVLLSTGRSAARPGDFPWRRFYQMLRSAWRKKGREAEPGMAFSEFWERSMRRGGAWAPRATGGGPREPRFSEIAFRFRPPPLAPREGRTLLAYPTIQFFDGRGANRPWLQELPDPITQITWGGWVEIHSGTAGDLGIRKGDLLRLESPHGVIEAPAFPTDLIAPGALAMPIGQGHAAFGRFAGKRAESPVAVLSAGIDPLSGGRLWVQHGVVLKKLARSRPLASTDGHYSQLGRGIARTIPLRRHIEALREGAVPDLRLPLPGGYDPKVDFYPPHAHPRFRWIMVVDLDRCIGCGACVVACYAENNVAVVGRRRILQGREMSWIRIQRYLADDWPRVRFVPMLCQHCDNAPCESVCPVYAPHHSADGLNNQVYNRCIGTRFCSQNCPYKVRRFNWFTFRRAEPLEWQLNPDVTVRQKGVMEKCSFCVQRIVEAKIRAGREGRWLRDGEVLPACVQTCPTGALVFGNLKDPASRVSRLVRLPRAYQIFGQLNTKPAVIYLKRLTRESGMV